MRRCAGNRVSTTDRDLKMLVIRLSDELDEELKKNGFVNLGNLSEEDMRAAECLANAVVNRLVN